MAYKRMHEFPLEGEKTEKQWNKAGYKIKRGIKGQECWTNRNCRATAIYYNNSQIEEMNEIEKLNYKHKINLEKQRKRIDEEINKIKDEIKETAFNEGLALGKTITLKDHVYKTAREWLKEYPPRKVKDDCCLKKEIVSGDKIFGENYGFKYYHVYDTAECSVDEARILLNDWNKKVLRDGEKYCGLKWWKNKDDEDYDDEYEEE